MKMLPLVALGLALLLPACMNPAEYAEREATGDTQAAEADTGTDTATDSSSDTSDVASAESEALAEAEAGPEAIADAESAEALETVGPPERSCLTRFAFTPQGPVAGVFLAGEWDWSARDPLADADGDGTWTLDKDLPAGIHAYKIVTTAPADGAESWFLDPVNAYRAYDNGVENSGMRVGDCHQPLLERVSFQAVPPTAGTGGAQATVRFVRASGGPGPDPDTLRVALLQQGQETAAPVMAADWDEEWATWTVSAEGLAAGKYTLHLEVSDLDGHPAQPLDLPFWMETEAFDWRDGLLYMVMTDRFVDGDPLNNPAPTAGAAPTADWQGGDLAGVTQVIESGHLDQLGVRALWLSPFNRNPEHGEMGSDGVHGVTGYHGYWPVRAREVDPRLGGAADLKAMVQAAHRHGIRVLMDLVWNHVHLEHEYYAAHPDWFRTGCICGTEGCDWTEHRLDCLFAAHMPDLNWTVRPASEQFIADALWWLAEFDLDGFRVDAVKHVEDLAVINLSIRVREAFEQGNARHFLVGETAMGWGGDNLADSLDDYATISRYIGPDALDGQFDFVLFHATANQVFANSGKGLIHLDYWTRMSLEHYPADAIMTPYVGSHDTTRFITLATYRGQDADHPVDLTWHKWPEQGLPQAPQDGEPYGRAALALTWLATGTGLPLLYYGDEYGEFGGADPDNRHLWRDQAARTEAEQALLKTVQAAGQARRTSPALRRGAYVPVLAEESFLVVARVLGGEAALVVLNRSGQAATRTVTVPGEVPLADGALKDLLDPAAETVPVSERTFEVSVGEWGARVLVPN